MSYRPMFQFSDETWAGNAQRFATHEEAMKSAASRFQAWTMPTAYRADESDDLVNYEWHDDAGDVMINREVAA